jgi:hypothetical protein
MLLQAAAAAGAVGAPGARAQLAGAAGATPVDAAGPAAARLLGPGAACVAVAAAGVHRYALRCAQMLLQGLDGAALRFQALHLHLELHH